MGLIVSHGCWDGGYMSFNAFRQALAKAADIPLALMEGYYKGAPEYIFDQLTPGSKFAMEQFFLSGLPIAWKLYASDPICVLLAHSDCSGEIAHKHCKPLADRMEGMLPALETLPDAGGHLGNIAEAAKRFIAGLRLAHKKRQKIRFS